MEFWQVPTPVHGNLVGKKFRAVTQTIAPNVQVVFPVPVPLGLLSINEYPSLTG